MGPGAGSSGAESFLEEQSAAERFEQQLADAISFGIVPDPVAGAHFLEETHSAKSLAGFLVAWKKPWTIAHRIGWLVVYKIAPPSAIPKLVPYFAPSTRTLYPPRLFICPFSSLQSSF
jgi:hypothetical protein